MLSLLHYNFAFRCATHRLSTASWEVNLENVGRRRDMPAEGPSGEVLRGHHNAEGCVY